MILESALRELGKEIQADPRFEALQKAAKVNDADENLQSQMQEMQLITLKYQQEAEKGEEASQERIAELQQEYQDLYTKVMDGENMKNYSAAAAEMEQMAQYISQMIGLFFDGQDPATCEIPASDCTHDCCTCGGCH